MSDRTMKIPGPEHPITIRSTAGRVVVKAGGRIVADSRAALTLQEASYPAVQYIPRDDVLMDFLSRSDHSSYCPYKGEASYFSIPAAGARATNAIWTYEHPYDAVASIRDHLAFYPDRIDSLEILPSK